MERVRLRKLSLKTSLACEMFVERFVVEMFELRWP